MSPGQIVILKALAHCSRSEAPGTCDIEFDAPLWRSACALQRAGIIEITEPLNEYGFCARFAHYVHSE